MSVLPFNDKQIHQLSTSIAKAINPAETRVKEKHVRIAIIGTYQEKGGNIFWTYVLRQQLQENRIVAWKFCHVLHKILREGHPRVIADSQRYRGKLEDIGKLWQHLREEYGRLIHLYIRLLITKLDFHKRNPRMPGNLQVTPEELEAIGENDINVYFQMTVEMFDYMDDILNLQQAVFGSLDLSKSNSMTPCGQCRLAPLIPCVQDASQLYDYCVKMLFKLHSALPADTLSGHRDRFLKQFRELKSFYNTVMHMHYFKHLITIPSLPENPPNFLIQAELRSYVTPVVVLPPEEPIDTEGALIDTSDTSSLPGDNAESSLNGTISPDALVERDSLIDHLHHENARQRQELQRLLNEHQNIVGDLRNRVLELESILSAKGNEILQEKQSAQEITKQREEILLQCTAAEEKSKNLEEKFQKLKDVYTKLREEHINLIRKKAEVDKQLGSMKLTLDQSERRTLEAEQRLDEQIQGQATVEQEAQRVVQARADLEEVRKEFDASKTENLSLLARIDFITSEKAAVEGELHDLSSQKDELEMKMTNLQAEAERSLAQVKADFDATLYDLLLTCLSEAEAMLQNAMHVVDNPAVSAVTCTPDYLASLLRPTDEALNNLSTVYTNYTADSSLRGQLMRNAIHTAFTLATYIMQAKFTSNTSKDITFGDRLTDECKQLGSQGLIMMSYMKEKSASTTNQIQVVRKQLEKISGLADSLSKALGNPEVIGDLVETELMSMDKAIEEAAARIQEMLDKSRAADSGVKLEVNGKILDSCTDLMKGIRNLVKKSRFLQMEIVAQGKGSASAHEFYKRNHQWSEGLISAAKAIGTGANFLLEAADEVVLGNGKFEKLVVASQGIAASTAQLVVASRVKADRNSSNLSALSEASRLVMQATGGVVATAKSCSQLVEDNEDMDISGLSLHQAKRLEMEAQVRVLELEQALETERLKLAALRRYHYQMADENEG
ncbi:huntingtin-interacting protein 1 [Copidosoma floridanum]|uniref:huntingtin-interacting protein 1 n=1 Tax=Copidosoma floridanum TaxID=29053 RepID=UPI0006C965B6|nr:huntingtin-interacting protein 1 [Copidosoma floridanum]